MNYAELKETITEQGQPFIWLTPAGWFFHEQPDSKSYTREQVMEADSFEQLEANDPAEKTEPIKKTSKKK